MPYLLFVEPHHPQTDISSVFMFVLIEMIGLKVAPPSQRFLDLIATEAKQRDKNQIDAATDTRHGQRDEGFSIRRPPDHVHEDIVHEGWVVYSFCLEVSWCVDIEETGYGQFNKTTTTTLGCFVQLRYWPR